MASSCVPASHFESPRRPLTTGDMESILSRSRALGVAEMMNFPAVIAGDPVELAKLELAGATHADGHAPGVRGAGLDAYLAAGIRSDHEATTLRGGAREASQGHVGADPRGLQRAQPASPCCRWWPSTGPRTARSAPTTASRISWSTRAHQPDVPGGGGAGHPARGRAAAGDAAPALAATASTDLGAIAPGFSADLVLLPDLERSVPTACWKDGRLVVDGGAALPFDAPRVPAWVRQTVRIAPARRSQMRTRRRRPGSPCA